MRISQVFRNSSDAEGSEYILVFDDGHRAYLSETRVVLRSPQAVPGSLFPSDQVGALLRAGLPGKHGELIQEFVLDGMGGFFGKDFTDDHVYEWLEAMGPEATITRYGEVVTNEARRG